MEKNRKVTRVVKPQHYYNYPARFTNYQQIQSRDTLRDSNWTTHIGGREWSEIFGWFGCVGVAYITSAEQERVVLCKGKSWNFHYSFDANDFGHDDKDTNVSWSQFLQARSLNGPQSRSTV